MTANCRKQYPTRRPAPSRRSQRPRDTDRPPRTRPTSRPETTVSPKASKSPAQQDMSKTATKPTEASKKPRRRPWRHPTQRGIKVPYAAAAAISLMEMGITDYDRIAAAVGLNAAEVERIDMAEDKSIRQLCLTGVPYGHYFTLEHQIRCPKCSGMITLAPCVACDAPSAWRPAVPDNVVPSAE